MKEITTDKKITVKEVLSRAENETKVTIRLPGEIAIELVQSNELRGYEIFMWLAGLLATIAASFWTAFAVDLLAKVETRKPKILEYMASIERRLKEREEPLALG